MSDDSQKFRWRGVSIFRGEFDDQVWVDELPPSDLVEAWLDDPDIMELTITSPSIGFSYTITKPRPGWTRSAGKS